MLKNVCIGLCLFYCFNVNGQLINNMPVKKRFDSLELVKVSPQYNESDYLALMKSKAFIHELLNNDTWPGDHLTQEQNLATLINDLNQFDAGENFTFHIFDASDQIIGCIYITPTIVNKNDIQFSSFYWLVPEYQDPTKAAALRYSVTQWLLKMDGVTSVNFPFNE